MRHKLKPIAEQVMVITGASSGIGLRAAREAAERGAKVLLVDRNELALRRAVQEITACGDMAAYAVADVGVPAEAEAAARLAAERFGRIDTWVNDAGVAIYATLEQTPFDEHERLFRINYFGVVNGAQAALPYLKQGGGALITIGLTASGVPSPLLGAYAASQQAVKGFLDSLRIELAAERVPVSVTLIKPSGMETPIGEQTAHHQPQEALVPPPVHDSNIVADTIIHAAQHPRREITVGRFSRANVLVRTHFPRLLKPGAPLLMPLPADRNRLPAARDGPFGAGDDGQMRAGMQTGGRISLYTSASRHRAIAGLGIGAIAGLAALLLSRRKSLRPD